MYVLKGHIGICTRNSSSRVSVKSDLHHLFTGLVRPHRQCYQIGAALVAIYEPRPCGEGKVRALDLVHLKQVFVQYGGGGGSVFRNATDGEAHK